MVSQNELWELGVVSNDMDIKTRTCSRLQTSGSKYEVKPGRNMTSDADADDDDVDIVVESW